MAYSACITVLTLDLSPSRAGQHIGQCVSSNHLCPPPLREHLSTSVPILTGLRGWSPANSSLVFLFPFFVLEASSSLVWLFYFLSYHCPASRLINIYIYIYSEAVHKVRHAIFDQF